MSTNVFVILRNFVTIIRPVERSAIPHKGKGHGTDPSVSLDSVRFLVKFRSAALDAEHNHAHDEESHTH